MRSDTCGQNLRWELDDDGTLTIEGEGYMYAYALSPWHDNNLIKKVIIKNGVLSLSEDSFIRCASLTSVTIPDSITWISNRTFSMCENLANVEFGNCVKTICEAAFYNCKSLTSLMIPNSVTIIGNGTFCECTGLTSLTISNSVEVIGAQAFCNCSNLTNLTIGNSVNVIGAKAFDGCKSLTNMTIPDSVTTIYGGAFIGCSSLTSVVVPDSVTEIREEIFRDCTSLKKIYYKEGSGFESKLSQGNNAKLIPMTNVKNVWWQLDGNTLTVGCVREVEDYSREDPPWVADREKIQKLVVENGVKKISAHAFEHCPNLEQLELPASVTNIGDMAFPFSFCGNSEVNGGKNVFWCLEDGILTFKKNPAATGNDFSTGAMTWRVVDKNVRGVKLEHDIKPTGNLIEWLFFRLDGKKIFFE